MKNSSRFDSKDRQELGALEQRRALVDRLRQDAALKSSQLRSRSIQTAASDAPSMTDFGASSTGARRVGRVRLTVTEAAWGVCVVDTAAVYGIVATRLGHCRVIVAHPLHARRRLRAFRAASRGGYMPSRHLARLFIGIVVVTVGIGATALAVRHRVVVGVQARWPDPGAERPGAARLPERISRSTIGRSEMVFSPNGALLAVVTGSNFNPRALHLIDVTTRTLKQTIPIANSFVGVAFNPAGDTIYVGGGASNDVKIFKAAPGGSFAASGTIPISGGPAPSGLTLDANGSRLMWR